MVLSEFRPAYSTKIPENCLIRQTPSNLYNLEQFDFEFAIVTTDNRKAQLFYSACELVGWADIHETIYEIYISPFKDKKQNSLDYFKEFCERCMKTSPGRFIISKFSKKLINEYLEAANLMGRY